MITKLIRKISILLLILFTSCNGQNSTNNNNNTEQTTFLPFNKDTETTNKSNKDIRAVFQDKKNNYWFATYGEGVYYSDGKNLFQFTDKDGLCSNFVLDIQEDIAGNLWFNTSEGLCRFDGKKFTDFTDTLKNVSKESLEFKNNDLFFCYNGIVYRYDGKNFTKFSIHPTNYHPSSTNLDRPYGVYCFLKDRSGNLWFGTDQKGVCRFDGKKFTYFTEYGLNGGAVRAMFQDKNGIIWFGNNGYGLFYYDGKKLTNLTKENGLENFDFINKRTTTNSKANLARVWAINEDKEGNLWIGTIDNGIWKYAGKELKNFTTKDGLANNKISSIYKDRQDYLWFITEGEGISKLNKQTFVNINLNN